MWRQLHWSLEVDEGSASGAMLLLHQLDQEREWEMACSYKRGIVLPDEAEMLARPGQVAVSPASTQPQDICFASSPGHCPLWTNRFLLLLSIDWDMPVPEVMGQATGSDRGRSSINVVFEVFHYPAFRMSMATTSPQFVAQALTISMTWLQDPSLAGGSEKER